MDWLVHRTNKIWSNQPCKQYANYSLKLSKEILSTATHDGGVEEIVANLDCPLTNKCSHHNADRHAGQQLAEWTKIICAHPVDVRDW